MLRERVAPDRRVGDGLPPFAGGQGREPVEIEQDGRVVGVAVICMAALCVLLSIWVAVAELQRQIAELGS